MSAANKSSVSIDGLRILNVKPNLTKTIDFKDFYEIKKLDKVKMTSSSPEQLKTTYIDLGNCSNATFTDTVWNDLYFFELVSESEFNRRSNCISGNISVTGQGLSYGSKYASDPNAVLTFDADSDLTCEWTGAADSTWDNPSNWGSCEGGSLMLPMTFTFPQDLHTTRSSPESGQYVLLMEEPVVGYLQSSRVQHWS